MSISFEPPKNALYIILGEIQTLISSTNDLTTNQEQNNSKHSSYLSKNRLTFVPPLITNSSTNSVTPKLLIQQNTTSNIWSQQPKTKIRNDKNILVHFKGEKNLVGKIIDVKIKESKPFYLIGEKLEDNA